MADYPLVSIITPCYNGANYLNGYFEGILTQNHRNIELIFVDDGSTDDTALIAKAYGEKLEKQGMRFIYIFQENAGQAAAINKGLAIFSGDYLTWLDADDIMLPDNLSKKLEVLHNNAVYGFALNGIQLVEAEHPEHIIGEKYRIKPKGEDHFFADMLFEKNVLFVPGTLLVRRECVLEAIPDKKIYESKEGQNWQLILPLAYLYKCAYVEAPLLKCVVHRDSHSRRNRNMVETILREEEFIRICSETIKNIPQMSELEKNKWYSQIRVYHYQKIMRLAVKKMIIRFTDLRGKK